MQRRTRFAALLLVGTLLLVTSACNKYGYEYADCYSNGIQYRDKYANKHCNAYAYQYGGSNEYGNGNKYGNSGRNSVWCASVASGCGCNAWTYLSSDNRG